MTPEEQAAADAAAAQAAADAAAAEADAANAVTLEQRLAKLEGKLDSTDKGLLMASVLGDAARHPVGQFFAQNYQGEMTVDAITEAATTLRLVGDAPDPLAQAGFSATLDLRAGSIAPGTDPGPHPNEQARQNAEAARKVGTEADALGAYVEGHSRAVLAGDRRSVIDPRSPRYREPKPYADAITSN